MALGTAFRAFFAALFNRKIADEIRRVLDEAKGAPRALPEGKAGEPAEAAKQAAPPAKSARSDAIALLATLQREARLVDLVQEKLDQFSDAQVGAAARPCLQQCAATLDRLLGLEPLLNQSEGETVEVAEDASPARYQWIGEGNATSGKLIHHGWQASRVDLPEWTGRPEDSQVVAPAQIER